MARHYSPDVVGLMDEAMDAALARLDGPFESFEKSLVAFARANYGLRLESGRCKRANLAECGGFYYDPKGMYATPPLEGQFDLNGAALAYDGSVPASYGMDFIEVNLDAAVQGQPLTITFQSEGEVARFDVQIWKLETGSQDVAPEPESVPRRSDGTHVYTAAQIDTTGYDRLALIVTRLDADETEDPMGSYRITLESTGQPAEEAAVE